MPVYSLDNDNPESTYVLVRAFLECRRRSNCRILDELVNGRLSPGDALNLLDDLVNDGGRGGNGNHGRDSGGGGGSGGGGNDTIGGDGCIGEGCPRWPVGMIAASIASDAGESSTRDQIDQQTFRTCVVTIDKPDFIVSQFEQHTGTWTSVGGDLRSTGLPAVATYKPCRYYGDVKVTMRSDVTAFFAERQVLARYDPVAKNGYQVNAQNGASLLLQRIDAGVFTTLGTFPNILVDTDDIEIRCVGTTISAYLNGVLKGFVVDATYSRGRCGLGGSGFAAPAIFNRFYIERP